MTRKPKCRNNAIVDWWRANPDRIPRNLAELTEFPLAFRRMVLNVVDAETRARFWTEHMTWFLGPDSGLTTEQMGFLSRSIEAFDGATLPWPDWKEEATSLFSIEQAHLMFHTLGPPEPPEGLPLPPGVRLDWDEPSDPKGDEST